MSRDLNPKQFQPVEGFGSQSFFQQTVLRHATRTFAKPLVVSASHYAETVADQLHEIGQTAQVLLEPVARGTGPAVLAAALTLARTSPKALMLVAPSDHVIKGDMSTAISAAKSAALGGHIVVFGVTPRYAETGFGYVLDAGPVMGHDGLRRSGGFVEKPSHYKASELIASESAYWASGLSLFTAETLIAEYAKFAPSTLDAVKAALSGSDRSELSAPSYMRAQNTSTEQLIFQNSERLMLAPMDVEWDDLGCWTSMHSIGARDPNGNLLQGDVLSVQSKNSMVRGDDKLVALVGVSDLIVVDTPDALLVTKRGRCQNVRKVVESLKQARRQEVRAFPHDPVQTVPQDHGWGESLRLKQAGQVDMSLLRVAAGHVVHLTGACERQVMLLSGRVNVARGGHNSWLSAREQLVLAEGEQAHLENPDDKEVEALVMNHRTPVLTPNTTNVARVAS
jgi:mannose-1-phosphate guanylyltransferase/mannose-6-phosphate isomerase